MLFYSNQNSPRLSYILELISNEIFNEPFTLISDKDAFISYTGTKLNYSDERLSGNEFFIKNQELLFETDIHQQQIKRIDYLGKPAFLKRQVIILLIFSQHLFFSLAGMKNIFSFSLINSAASRIRILSLSKKIFLISL